MISGKKYCLALFIAFCGTWAACTQQHQSSPTCLTPTVASLNIVSMHIISDTGTVFYDTVLPDAEFVPLNKNNASAIVDSIIFPQASLFTISLSPASDTCRWLVRADTTGILPRDYAYDTLTFVYQRDLQFLSNTCGYTDFYTLDTVLTSHINIDSVLITNYSVTNDVSAMQLQIYIHPDF
jgi:hypothetical protein